MPFKSKAQMRKMFSLENSGKIKKGTARKFIRKTHNIKSLPEKIADKRKAYRAK